MLSGGACEHEACIEGWGTYRNGTYEEAPRGQVQMLGRRMLLCLLAHTGP
jgi:hypothetical protein